MVVKKPTKSLESRKKSAKAILTEPVMVTAVSTVGSDWGIEYAEKDDLVELIRLLRLAGVKDDDMARIIRGYLSN